MGYTPEFYIYDDEANFADLFEKPIQDFIGRMENIRATAASSYQKILKSNAIEWTNQNHVRAVAAVCRAFQDFSFARSSSSDLYQLVFYNFANKFKRDEAAQFLTPLPVIDFLVRVVNPVDGETVLDPCCGIGDFLSLAFVNGQEKEDASWHLDDANIYGVDLDEEMIMLATLNMLLNGDGEAKLFQKPDKGSILSKVADADPPSLVDLRPDYHANGNWDQWPDSTQLKKFDVILTNPPFGRDRAYRPRTASDRRVIEMYQTWQLVGRKYIDLGVVFLENAYQCLEVEGRLGIVLSNSIASINQWQKVREWLMERMRIVALFDLPSNVFAETGVNTTLIVAYKPKPEELQKLKEFNYSVFAKDIQNVGYEKRTRKRNVFFNDVYRFNEETFEILTDEEGYSILNTDFPEALAEFRSWALGQEETLQRLFLKGL